jgi:N-acetylneuraminate synthase/N,N'-diacetyllegionaminate synthase
VQSVSIAGRRVGDRERCFVIAEAGVNHNGDLERAKEMIDTAAGLGADAVKFQTFRAEKLVTRTAEKAEYQEKSSGSGTQYDMLKRLELTDRAFYELSAYSKQRSIIFLSSAFDFPSADLLGEIGVEAYKMGSGELTNLPLLRHVAGRGKPMILSSGMSTLNEVREALDAVRLSGCKEVVLLHCTSSYPAGVEDANLRMILTLKTMFGIPIGFSDHTPSKVVPAAAVALGAVIVEKHFTLDHDLPGPDHQMSFEPDEFREMVENIRTVEFSLGDGVKRITEAERHIREIARRSVVAAVDIPTGAVITREMLDIKRPGTGIEPKYLDKMIGMRATKRIAPDELIHWDLLA